MNQWWCSSKSSILQSLRLVQHFEWAWIKHSTTTVRWQRFPRGGGAASEAQFAVCLCVFARWLGKYFHLGFTNVSKFLKYHFNIYVIMELYASWENNNSPCSVCYACITCGPKRMETMRGEFDGRQWIWKHSKTVQMTIKIPWESYSGPTLTLASCSSSFNAGSRVPSNPQAISVDLSLKPTKTNQPQSFNSKLTAHNSRIDFKSNEWNPKQ